MSAAPPDDDGHDLSFNERTRRPYPERFSDRPLPTVSTGMDMHTMWHTVRERWRFVALSGLVCMLTVLCATLCMRMTFKATGRLYLGEIDGRAKQPSSGEMDFAGSGAGDVASELEIIKSRSNVLKAIARSGLNASIVPADWSPPRLGAWLLSGRDAALIQGASRVLAIVDAALPAAARKPRTFRIRFTSRSAFQVYADAKLIGKGALGGPVTTPQATFTLLPGPEGAPGSGSAYDLNVAPIDETAAHVLDTLIITTPKPMGPSGELAKVITLEFSHRFPKHASSFLDCLMHAYLDERQAWKTADASAAEAFVTTQLGGLRDTLDNTQKRLADYRSNTNLVVFDNEAKAMIEQMAKYEEQRVAARLQVAALTDIKRVLRDPNPPVEAYLLGEANDTVLEELGRSLANSRRQLTDLEGKFHEAAPDVRNQKAQIAAQLGTIRNYVTSRLARAQENLGTLGGIISQFEAKLKTVPGAELGLAQLARESDVYSKLYSYLLERQQQAAILKASTVSKNRILDIPEAPSTESKPRPLLSLVAGVLGTLLGLAAVVFRRAYSPMLQSDSEVRVLVGERSILASLPRAAPATLARARALSPHPYENIVGDRTSPSAEAFRTLRANLYGAAGLRTGNVMLVTSPTPGDGKTTTVLSLAAMLAADQKWVLVVDADLRKPSHDTLLHLPVGRGFRGILSGECKWRDTVRPVSGRFGEFFSIGAGDVDTIELTSNERLERFLSEARTRYDFVLIDGPSFPIVADPLVLVPLADRVLSVVRLGHTPRSLAEEHVRRISEIAEFHSVVINDATPLSTYGYGTAANAAKQRKSILKSRSPGRPA
jgi:tyrosine-protein kinase Etk/Wzc